MTHSKPKILSVTKYDSWKILTWSVWRVLTHKNFSSVIPEHKLIHEFKPGTTGAHISTRWIRHRGEKKCNILWASKKIKKWKHNVILRQKNLKKKKRRWLSTKDESLWAGPESKQCEEKSAPKHVKSEETLQLTFRNNFRGSPRESAVQAKSNANVKGKAAEEYRGVRWDTLCPPCAT